MWEGACLYESASWLHSLADSRGSLAERAVSVTLTDSEVQEDGHIQRVLVPEGQRVAVGTPVVRAPGSLRACCLE